MELVIKNIRTEGVIKLKGDLRISPRMYDGVRKILFEMDGVDLLRYLKTKNCEACNLFFSNLGTSTEDWVIEPYGILDLVYFSQKYDDNSITYKISDYFNGTRITFIFKNN